MNQLITTVRKTCTRFATLIVMLLSSVAIFAQDEKKVDVNINAKSDGGFLNNPVVWIIGGAVFILLLVALLRNNNKSNA